MINLFLTVLSMSLTASYCILFVFLARLLLKKAPKTFSYFLWIAVAFRLICPWSLDSEFSLVGEQVAASAENILDSSIFAEASGEFQADSKNSTAADSEKVTASFDLQAQSGTSEASAVSTFARDFTDSLAFLLHLGAFVWPIGVLLLFIHCLFTCLCLKKRLKAKVVETNFYHSIPVKIVPGLDTPFVLGIIKPVIYLPDTITAEEKQICLAHEYTHISRRDPLIKQASFLLCCVHWFNPLVWLAFYLMSQDMEMSCDEITLHHNATAERKVYSQTLLRLSGKERVVSGCPLSFGENNVKARIRNIMNYKKPGFWILLFSILFVIFCVFGLTLNPIGSKTVDSLSNEEAMEKQLIEQEKKALEAAIAEKQLIELRKTLEAEIAQLERELENQELQQQTPQEEFPSVYLSINGQTILVETQEGTYSYEETREGQTLTAQASIFCKASFESAQGNSSITIGSAGTAYPIRYDDEGIYAAGGHFVAKYSLNVSDQQMVLSEYATENFDSDGNVSYIYFNLESGEIHSDEDAYLKQLLEQYGNAQVLDFSVP